MNTLPIKFKERMTSLLGDGAAAFFAALDEPSALALRVNPLRPGVYEAAAEYADGGVPWEKLGYYLKGGVRPGMSIAHFAGAFYLQEASAMAAVAALEPQGGETILDLCAAPGGKTTQIAARMAGRGLLVANEYEPARAKVLAANLERMGVTNAIAVNARPDALAKKWGARFDAVLCDAPCSGEGMFRREPASRDEWTEGAPAGCAHRQAEILDSAARLVRPGGRLVYSTCTFAPEEDEEGIAAFLARHPEFAPEDFALEGVGPSKDGMLRLYPHLLRGDGHFCARLRRTGEAKEGKPVKPKADAREDAEILAKLEKEICALPDMPGRTLMRFGEYLYAVPGGAPDTASLRVARAGLCLCRIGRSHIEPDHALAMACGITPRRRIELGIEEAERYLRGEALEKDAPKGWTLVTYADLPLGWAKLSDGILKNHLPAGLRRH